MLHSLSNCTHAVSILHYSVVNCGIRKYRNIHINTAKTKDFIKARWNQDFRLEDFKKVIDIKTAEWLNTDSDKYLRPETLFGSKFEGYLNQKIQPTGTDQLERMKYDESYWD